MPKFDEELNKIALEEAPATKWIIDLAIGQGTLIATGNAMTSLIRDTTRVDRESNLQAIANAWEVLVQKITKEVK
jgi:hypothetical protein